MPADQIAVGLRHGSMGAHDSGHPDLQLADGCLVDQLVGEYAASLVGLGELLDPTHVGAALQSVYDRNFRRGFGHVFNPMRSFVLGDEAAVQMCSYDDGKRPKRPFPYFAEVMTGFEYTAATGLLQVGATGAALEIVEAIRDRYDGAKRNPFDEAECGHHYARALASWSAFATWNGISYSGIEQVMVIGDRRASGTAFWSTGTAFGTWEPGVGEEIGTLCVVGGDLDLRRLVVAGRGYRSTTEHLTSGERWTLTADSVER